MSVTRGNMSVKTKIFDANSQPMLVGGFIDNYSKEIVSKKGVIVSKNNDDLVIDENTKYEKTQVLLRPSNLSDIRFIDCTDVNEEQFACALQFLIGNTDYYVRAFVIDTYNNVIYGETEKVHSQNYNRYNGSSDVANVYYYNSNTLFDVVTDEIIPKEDGYYGSTNETPTEVAFKPSYACYKYKTEWNYKLWYSQIYGGTVVHNPSKVVHLPVMKYANGLLTIEKNPLDADKTVTIYYSLNGNYFRPETYTNVYSAPINVTEPCVVYCYAISSDDYISYTNMYVVGDYIIENDDNFGKVAEIVDLGLSVKWASWNVGASKIADYGGLYGAGDPTGLKTSTSYSDYHWVDGENICGTEYDLAHVKWGGKWQLPTIEQLKELKEKCSWKHNVIIDNVKGSMATGPNGNTLFFPYAGSRTGSSNPYIDKHTSLWAGEAVLDNAHQYKDMDINLPSGSFQFDGGECYYGQSIRPVYNDSVSTTPDVSTKRTIHVEQAGTLPKLISESEKYSIEELTLTGKLNSTDFKLIRDMAGCDYLGRETPGMLKTLNLSDAKIVKGGQGYYHKTLTEYNIYQDNILPLYVFGRCRLSSVSIPNSVTSIGSSAFYACNSLTSITIPNSVTSIGSGAFSDCSGLISITIPNSVTNIGNDAFGNCSGLISITIPNSVTSIENGTFVGCSGLTSIMIPNSVTNIGNDAFGNCSSLTSITIPNSVISIGSYAFYGCCGLTSITIPNSVTSIGNGTFGGCSGLTSIFSKIENPFSINENVFPKEAYSATLYVPFGSKDKYMATAGWNQFKDIVEISTNNGDIFTDDVNGVTMSFKVTDVDNLTCQFGSGEESAVSQSVTNISIPNETKGLKVVSIADNSIVNCASLLSVSFPETIETVGLNVLTGCTNLAAIKWNAERAVPDALISGVNNPNLLLYVKDKSYAPAYVKNVVANGMANEIVLKETDGGNNFYCPETFKAKRVSFVHNYSMTSGYKECRGWETIVLPFNVTSIMSETGSYVVPRAAWTVGDSQQKPFFLYEWTTTSWQPATAIKANIPYIISMPNNENYDPIYQLKGDFEFVGTNVEVLASDSLETVVYNNKRFVPNYQNKEASQSMLPLNVNNLWDKNTKTDYTEGSAFLRGLRAVRPFEAYMMMEEGMAAPQMIPVFENEATGIMDVLLTKKSNSVVTVYSLNGQQVKTGEYQDVMKHLSKGVYIVNGRKVVVK